MNFFLDCTEKSLLLNCQNDYSDFFHTKGHSLHIDFQNCTFITVEVSSRLPFSDTKIVGKQFHFWNGLREQIFVCHLVSQCSNNESNLQSSMDLKLQTGLPRDGSIFILTWGRAIVLSTYSSIRYTQDCATTLQRSHIFYRRQMQGCDFNVT